MADDADAGADARGESFPRQWARTQRLTLGAPRSFSVSRDGQRVLFLRSRSGSDRVNCLWSLDVSTGEEQLVVDPTALVGATEERLSVAERARRERAREASAGIVAYSTDGQARQATFALSGGLWVVDLGADRPHVRGLAAAAPVIDPRLDPTGRWVAYVSSGALRLVAVDGSSERVLAEPDAAGGSRAGAVTWGLAEFVAAEEMERSRGYWWAPDGSAVLAARVDESPVQRWYIADPANPATAPVEVAYPAAGTPNAVVTLHVLAIDGGRTDVPWDSQRFPYLVSASWDAAGDPLVHVMSRDQRSAQMLAVDVTSGGTRLLHEDRDDRWLDVVPGVPAWLPDGRLVRTADVRGARRIIVGDDAVTPDGVQVSHVISVGDEGVLFAATEEPTESHVWRVTAGGDLTRLTGPGGHHAGTGSGATFVRVSRSLTSAGVRTTVLRDGDATAEIASLAEKPCIDAAPALLTVGELDLRVGVLLPHGHVPGTPLPVVMDPYGGPHHQEVVQVHNMWLEPQWLADQGFAVIVADGRGTPSRGPEWDRAIHRNVADVALADQVTALLSVAEEFPDLDLSRVAVRGWSFGGYLAALAVLRRPDVFAAAVAGAPVTDWRLYDTFYSERYLGHPDDAGSVYDVHSLLRDARRLERPLLLIHGLADDNVIAAHTLRLSAAFLAAGRPHDVLPLSGVTHMTPQEAVAENLLCLQVQWLHRALNQVDAAG